MGNQQRSRWTRAHRLFAANLERVMGGLIVTGPLERDALEQGRDIDWGRSRRDALRATTEEYGDDAA